ncbi:PREDICTED: F-box [Prunus dulcis]|uniref:PREDICTED: F-box n=1 Tax=Prunus dulcis TaxID=3755 RepID=A0A5E4F9V8_PRUDU|nr:PREDICTED: F-box [Prunus dulcis]
MIRPRATKRSWSSRISQSKPIGEAPDHHQSPLKRSKWWAPKKSISKELAMLMNISLDDLPQFVLLEILSRLPPKCAARCMCVSKRWFSLIFDPYFFRHYFQIQSDNQNPIIARARARAIIISDRRRTTRRSKFLSTSSSGKPDEDEPCERKFFSMSVIGA